MLLATLALPAEASAHAVLQRTSPERGADLKTQPKEVDFFFNEPVETAFGAVRVFNSDGDEVQTGDVLRPGDEGSGVGTTLEPDLPDGTYTATYRVVSADSHPVSGGFVFSIGKPDSSGKPISQLLDEQGGTGGSSSLAFVADRWVGYTATALGVGALAFLLLAWRPSRRASSSDPAAREASELAFGTRMRALLLIAAAAGLLSAAASLPLQIASAADVSFLEALDRDYFSEVLSTRFGTVEAVRAGAWIAFGLLAASALAPRGGRSRAAWALVAPALVLVATPGLAGHAATQDPTALLLPVDFIHVAAMSLWLGGLAALLLAVPRATGTLAEGERSALLAAVLVRFSAVALACVAALAVTGVVQAIVELGDVEALVHTGFGRAILVKVGLLLLLAFAGYMNRSRFMPAVAAAAAAGRSTGRAGLRLRANLRLEVGGIAAVLIASSMMVGYAPPADTQGGPVSGTATFGGDYLEYTVEPATVGANELHLYLFDADDGSQVDPKEVTASARLPDQDVGPLPLDLRKAGPGHYVAPAASFGIAGAWTVDVAVRSSRFNQDDVDIDVPIR
jgi:copper transport protein